MGLNSCSFELFSLKIKFCICIKVRNLNGLNLLTPTCVEAVLTAACWMGMLWQELQDSVLFLHEQSSLWHLKANAKWSCYRAISCRDDSCCLPTQITCLDMLEWQTLPFSHCHNCSKPSSAGNLFQRREGGSAGRGSCAVYEETAYRK